jgi:hypothetical protein
MMASYYIVHCEEYIDYNYHVYKKKDTLYAKAQKVKKETKAKDNIDSLFKWIYTNRSNNIILVFYAGLNFLLIMDNKDIFVTLLFALEAITVPIHLHLHQAASPTNNNLRKIYLWYLPVFIACNGLVLFRYLLFFQK